jgi:hypothetical protein
VRAVERNDHPFYLGTLYQPQRSSTREHPHPLWLAGEGGGPALVTAAYLATGQLSKAQPLLEETLEKMKAKFGPDHTNTRPPRGNRRQAPRLV